MTLSTLLYYLALIVLVSPVFNAIARRREKARREREVAAAKAERAAAAAIARAEREARLAAEAAESAAAVPKRKRGRPRKNPLPQQVDNGPMNIHEQVVTCETTPDMSDAQKPVQKRPAIESYAIPRGNNAFAGETVSFTGTLPGMTRREAIEAVKANGGRAFESMPVSTTILVVGDKPGTRKLDNADAWIATCRKITPHEFKRMLERPLCLELDEAAAYIRSCFDHNDTCEEA